MQEFDEKLIKEKYCIQDTDGSWLLTAKPNTIIDLLADFESFLSLSIDRVLDEAIGRVEKAEKYPSKDWGIMLRLEDTRTILEELKK